MLLPKRINLDEAISGGDFAINRLSAIAGGFDIPVPDNIAKLEKWFKSCPDYSSVSHGAGCERCDTVWNYHTGGVNWLHRTDWSVHANSRGGDESNYPGHKFLEPLRDRSLTGLEDLKSTGSPLLPKVRGKKQKSDFGNTPAKYGYGSDGREIAPAIFNTLESENSTKNWHNTTTNIFAKHRNRSRIEELPLQEFSAQEGTKMNEYVRDLLRMSGGGGLGGRDRVSIPDELMDAMAGDAAQEAILQNRVLEEMRKQATPKDAGGKYVGLDLMVESMSKGDVDKFLSHARKKIIKRSKGTRKGCCAKIGGILDQLMGPAGGEYGDAQTAKDRGERDPIGEALSDDHKKLYAFRKGESRDARSARIAHHKKTGKHLDEADLANFIAEEFDLSDHDADCEFAAQLQAESEGYLAGPSQTASALGSFAEASHTGSTGNMKPPCYDDAKRTRDDNKEYPTALRSLGSAANYDSGKPGSVKGKHGERYKKGVDPIGENRDRYGSIDDDESDYERLWRHKQRRGVKKVKSPNLDNTDRRYQHSGPGSGGVDTRWREKPGWWRASDGKSGMYAQRDAIERSKKAREASRFRKQMDDTHYDGPQISETASALSNFMEAGHTGSVGSLKKPGYSDAKATRPDNKEYPTDLRSTSAGRNYDSGAPKSAKGAHPSKPRYEKDADPIGEDALSEGGMGAPDSYGVHFGEAPKELSDEERFARARKLRDERKKKHYAALRARKAAEREGQDEGVDHDGPQISETASALAGFMEAAHTGSAGNMSPTPYWGPKKTRDDNRKDYLKTGLGSTKGEHSKGAIDPSNTGEKKPRHDKGADPRGGATPKQLR